MKHMMGQKSPAHKTRLIVSIKRGTSRCVISFNNAPSHYQGRVEIDALMPPADFELASKYKPIADYKEAKPKPFKYDLDEKTTMVYPVIAVNGTGHPVFFCSCIAICRQKGRSGKVVTREIISGHVKDPVKYRESTKEKNAKKKKSLPASTPAVLPTLIATHIAPTNAVTPAPSATSTTATPSDRDVRHQPA